MDKLLYKMTVREIMDEGLWSYVCEQKGWNPYILNEGRILEDEVVEFYLEEELKENTSNSSPNSNSYEKDELSKLSFEIADLNNKLGQYQLQVEEGEQLLNKTSLELINKQDKMIKALYEKLIS